MKAHLVVVKGEQTGRTFELLANEPAYLGRMPDNRIVLPEPQVSRVHCQFVFSETRWKIVDLGGVNGTIVNGGRIKEHVLEPGDVIQVGKTLLRFGSGPIRKEGAAAPEESTRPAGPKTPKAQAVDPYDHKVAEAVGKGEADLAATVKVQLEDLQKKGFQDTKNRRAARKQKKRVQNKKKWQ